MSGFSQPGEAEKVKTRAEQLNYSFIPESFQTNYWGSAPGLINFRVDLDNTDYVVLAKLLELNATQESHLGSLIKYARDQKKSIPDLKTLKELLLYLIKYPEKAIGSSKESLGVIVRKIDNLEFSDFEQFFGEPEFNCNDFLGKAINILWLQNYQKQRFNAGNLVSFFLSKLYNDLPEVGNVTKPKLVIFIDEAHQIFDNANPKLVELIVTILKQIRSKGVGIIFNTQNADDIPEKILEQLGLKIQFALRAFSLKELQQIKGVVESFPQSEFYQLGEEVKSLAIGTAFISTLNEAGVLLPPVKTVLFPPLSFMDAISLAELSKFSDPQLKLFYNQKTNSQKLDLGTPLDNISVSRGGNWQINTFMEHKEEQIVNRKVRKRNKEIKSFLIIILAILGFCVLMMCLALFLVVLLNQ